jgi:hypothetical protein
VSDVVLRLTGFDPAKHPRYPKGTPKVGGEFKKLTKAITSADVGGFSILKGKKIGVGDHLTSYNGKKYIGVVTGVTDTHIHVQHPDTGTVKTYTHGTTFRVVKGDKPGVDPMQPVVAISQPKAKVPVVAKKGEGVNDVGDVVKGATPAAQKMLDAAVARIEKVHGQRSNLKAVTPVKVAKTGAGTLGSLRYIPGVGPTYITISNKLDDIQAQATLTHELGHLLDMHLARGYGVKGGYLSSGANLKKSKAMTALMDALWDSEAIKSLRDLKAGPQKIQGKTAGVSYSVPTKHIKYLLNRNEQFARAYAQYIASKSGDTALKAKLQNHLSKKGKVPLFIQRQWTDKDFAPIEAAFDALFKEQGWV